MQRGEGAQLRKAYVEKIPLAVSFMVQLLVVFKGSPEANGFLLMVIFEGTVWVKKAAVVMHDLPQNVLMV